MAHIPAGASPKQIRSAHPYHMHDHILSQPDHIASIFEDYKTAAAIATDLKLVSEVHLVGIGTSWHAALIARDFWVKLACDHVHVHHSFEFAEQPPKLHTSSLVIIITHRGTKKYSLNSLKHAKAAGAVAVVITGQNSGVPAELSARILFTSPQEQSSAHTMSFTGGLARLLQLAVLTGVTKGNAHAHDAQSALSALPAQLRSLLQSAEQSIKEWAKDDHQSARKLHYFVANGINTALAYESALKVNETCFTPTVGYQLEQYIHGPRLATDSGSAVVIAVGPGSNGVLQRAYEAASWAKKVGADVTVVLQAQKSEDESLVLKLKGSFRFIQLPLIPHESFSPFLGAAVLQLFTYWKAICAKTNPDEFRADDPLYKDAEKEICGL